jgi:DNA-binding transcriptional MerR regulator
LSEHYLNATSERAPRGGSSAAERPWHLLTAVIPRLGQLALECALTLRVDGVTGWTTREAAEKCGLTQHTLRWYERIGLLGRISRTADGRRRFSDADLDWLLLLSRLRATGMSVRDMLRYAELVRSGAGEQERLELLEHHREHVREALREQQECLRLLDTKIGIYRERVCPRPHTDRQN